MADRWRFEGDAAYRFAVALKRKAEPQLDSKHRNIAGRLTRKAKENLEDSRLRDEERGSRPRSRLTGTLTGHSGRRSAIQGNALYPGVAPSGGRQGKGVGWPRTDVLDRRARHWRRLEFGTGPFKIPRGLFLTGKGGRPSYWPGDASSDVFVTYREYIRSQGLRRGTTGLSSRQLAARRRRVAPTGLRGSTFLVGKEGVTKKGIKAKHFLKDAWEEIVGPDGRKAFDEEVRIMRDAFREFIKD